MNNVDLTDFNSLVKQYQPLIWKAVNKFASDVIESDDLYQEALIALFNATKHYDASSAYTLGVYAKKAIDNRLKQYVGETPPHYFERDTTRPPKPGGQAHWKVVSVFVNSLDEMIERQNNQDQE